MAKTEFTKKVHQVVSKIQKGSVMSYAEVAREAGNPKAARAVARIMSANYDATIPCHRVICSDGSLGGYNRGGEKIKRNLLKTEGYYGHTRNSKRN